MKSACALFFLLVSVQSVLCDDNSPSKIEVRSAAEQIVPSNVVVLRLEITTEREELMSAKESNDRHDLWKVLVTIEGTSREFPVANPITKLAIRDLLVMLPSTFLRQISAAF